MKLHNKMCIKTKEKSFVFFNQMQNYIFEMIAEMFPYNNSFAFGSGMSQLAESEKKLEHIEFVKNSFAVDYNYDSDGKVFFVTKKVVFDESDDNTYYFSEVGVSPNSENESLDNVCIVNRFRLVDEAGNTMSITRKPKEYMEVEITIYFSAGDDMEVAFIGKDNNFAKMILGVYGGFKPIIGVAKGYSSISSGDRIIFSPKNFELSNQVGYDILLSDDGDSVNFNISGLFNEGSLYEVLILVDGIPCLRSRRFAESSNDVSVTHLSVSPNEYGCIVLENLISSGNVYVSDISSGESVSCDVNYYKSESDSPVYMDLYSEFDKFSLKSNSEISFEDYFIVDSLPRDFSVYYNYNNDIVEVDTSSVEKNDIKFIGLAKNILAVYYEDETSDSGRLSLYKKSIGGFSLIEEKVCESSEVLNIFNSKLTGLKIVEEEQDSIRISVSSEGFVYTLLAKLGDDFVLNIYDYKSKKLVDLEKVIRVESSCGDVFGGSGIPVYYTNQNRIYFLDVNQGIICDLPSNNESNIIMRKAEQVFGCGKYFYLINKNDNNLFDVMIYDLVNSEIVNQLNIGAKKIYSSLTSSIFYIEDNDGKANLWLYNKFENRFMEFRNEVNFDLHNYKPKNVLLLSSGVLLLFESKKLLPVYVPYARSHLAISGLNNSEKYNISTLSNGCAFYNKKNIRAEVFLTIY